MTPKMTPLRKQMIEAMQLRGFSPRTHESYLKEHEGQVLE